MGQTLTNGIYLPDEGERNSYSGLEVNWRTLDALILTVNGKAAPNVANTWTAAQTFTAGITGDLTGNVTGNLTGTAAKAIADEDGTSIKTGYVNVAGNQTVSGQKTWSGNQFYTAGAYHRNNSYEIGNTPASNVAIPIYFTDKVNVHTGYVRNVIFTTGKTQSELLARNKFTSGALSPTGTDVSSTLQVEVQSNGDKTLYFDGSIRNNVLPYATNTYALGSSSYQWFSVYAQTYYYNGTAWGLDKVNVWSQNQSVTNAVTPKFILQDTRNDRTYSASTTLSGGVMRWECDDKDGAPLSRISTTLRGDKVVQLQLAIFNEDSTGTEFDRTIRFAVGNTGSAVYYPEQTGNVDLGDSSHKWKTLNGVNPGALSLPSDSGVSFSGDITNTTGTANNPKTWTVNGWGYIRVPNSATSDFISVVTSDTHEAYLATGTGAGNSNIGVSFPIVAGSTYYIYVSTSGNVTAYYFPCLGNV